MMMITRIPIIASATNIYILPSFIMYLNVRTGFEPDSDNLKTHQYHNPSLRRHYRRRFRPPPRTEDGLASFIRGLRLL